MPSPPVFSFNTLTDTNVQSYVYDGENKQVKASNTNGLLGEYWYDGDGKRVRKYVPPLGSEPGETTIFVYDAACKLAPSTTAPQRSHPFWPGNTRPVLKPLASGGGQNTRRSPPLPKTLRPH